MGTVIAFPQSAISPGRTRLQGVLEEMRTQVASLSGDLHRALSLLSALPLSDAELRRARTNLLIQAGQLHEVHCRLDAIANDFGRGDLVAAAPAMMEQLFAMRRLGMDLHRDMRVIERHQALRGMA